MNLYKNRPQLPMKTWYLRSMLETGRYLTLKGHQNEAVLLWEQVADEASGSLREEAISLLKRQKESFAQ